MVDLLSSFLKGFSELFLTASFLLCTADECDENYNKMVQKVYILDD
jgi:hypothetical protein